MKKKMVPKRYFYVHLAIFAGLSSAIGVAGVSAYQDYRLSEASSPADARSVDPAHAAQVSGVLAVLPATATK